MFALTRQAFARRNVPEAAPAAGTWDYCYPLHPGVAHLRAFVTCSRGHISMLSSRRHQVSAAGVVSPSYVCPYDCDFHEFVQLVGWSPEEVAPPGQQENAGRARR